MVDEVLMMVCLSVCPQVHVTMKVAGLHWWRHTNSRAAEATAGYWNTSGRDGYDDVIRRAPSPLRGRRHCAVGS
jgi:hypothetical protein